MKAWIIYSEKDAKKNEKYIQFYFEEGKKRGIDFELLLTEHLSLGCDREGCYIKQEGKLVRKPDFAVVRIINPFLSSHLEGMGIPIYNSSKVALICNDKARTYQYLAARGIPCISTQFCHREEVFAKLDAGGFDKDEETVIKTVDGHGGSEVFLACETDGIREAAKHSDFVVQPRIHGRGQDIRVYVIGNQIIAAVKRQTREGFRANFSLGGEVELYSLNEEERKLTEKIISYFDFGMVGIDFLVEEDGSFIFNEIEDVVGARMLYQCSNINLVGIYLDYIVSNILSN